MRKSRAKTMFNYDALIAYLASNGISLRSMDRDPLFPLSEKTIRRSKFTGMTIECAEKFVDYLVDEKGLDKTEVKELLNADTYFKKHYI